MSCLPIAYVEQIVEATQPDVERTAGANSELRKVLKVLRLLRLAKLLRLGKIKKLMQTREEQLEELVDACQIFLVLLGLIYACHLAACMWYYVGGDESDPETGVMVQGWIRNRPRNRPTMFGTLPALPSPSAWAQGILPRTTGLSKSSLRLAWVISLGTHQWSSCLPSPQNS